MREDAYFPRSGKRSLVMDVVFVCMLLEGIFYVPIIEYLFKIGYNIETFERHWYACWSLVEIWGRHVSLLSKAKEFYW